MEPGDPLHDVAGARAIDARARADLGIDGYALMCRAAQAALDALLQRWPQIRRIAVVCGAGNNGGDGAVLARLARGLGMGVELYAVSSPPGTDEARRARDDWHAAGGRTRTAADAGALCQAELIVDALFGIGLRRPPSGEAADLIDAIGAVARPVLALDLPSGVDADTGATPGTAVRADATVEFIVAKRGLRTGRGRVLAGEILPASLDLAHATLAAVPASARLLRPAHLAGYFPPRARDAHKGRFGHVLCLGGDHGFAGAIRLSAEAALRTGAGLVSIATRAAHVSALVTARPECMPHAVESIEELAPLLARATALAIGPGLGQQDWGRALCLAVQTDARPRVFDADALNLLARSPARVPGAVLTPHPGEAARLLGCDVAAVEADRIAAASALVERFDAAVVLKGAGSVVAVPKAVPVVIDAGNPGMASGGMGDALTGIIASLLAQGFDLPDAARVGTLLHAVAGDCAAREGGERGLLASDLFPWLRRLVNPALPV